MDMLDSEDDFQDSGTNHQRGCRDILREYGALVEKIDNCFENINMLKHEVEKVTEMKRMELFPNKKTIENYDGTIKVLTEAKAYIEKELTNYEKRALDIRPDLYGIKNRYS